MFGIGATEFTIILIFAFLIFGPDKLPEIAKVLGRAIAKFREAQDEVNAVIKEEVFDPEKDKDDPFKKPMEKLSKLDGSNSASQETFSQRKARYDKERAERKAREAKAVAEAKAAEAEAAAKAAEAAGQGASVAQSAAKPAPKPKPKMTAEELYGVASVPKPEAKPKPTMSAEELYGIASAPAAKSAPSQNGGA